MIFVWLTGLFRTRMGRLAGTVAGIALTVALLCDLGTFIQQSSGSMTMRAIASVPVDWQVEVVPGADIAATTVAMEAAAKTTLLDQVGYANVDGFEFTTPDGTQTTGAGEVAGIGPDYIAHFPAGFRMLAGDTGGALLLQQTAVFHDEAVRIVSLGRLVSSASATGWVTIRVAETRNERDALAAEILRNAIIPVIALTLLAVALVWYGIGRMFAPLQQLETELRGRAPHDLSPLDIPVPIEVSHLVAALNAFMTRLGNAVERVTGLVAEAAHEVRTPLASLRAQAEVAMDERDPEALRRRISKIHLRAVQASQLVSQLLMDATISHRLDNEETYTTPFSAILDDVLQRLDPDQARRVRVVVDSDGADAEIRGDRLALREMLRNVVDNALVYSDGPIEITASVRMASLSLSIADRGPGIADDDKDLVQERFKRGANSAAKVGSGLGLSIVKRVTEAHGGTLALQDRAGGGLDVLIELPVVGRSAVNKLLADADRKRPG